MWSVLVIALTVCLASGEPASPLTDKLGNRQKRLLFFDEQGSLVQTHANPFFGNSLEDKNPSLLYNYLNPFYSIFRPTTLGTTVVYAVPVSETVLQHIKFDPFYHNKLIVISTKRPVVESNPLCAGRRTQIPSPKLCSSFLNCWDGWAFEQDCPAGLLFSKEGYCDYPHNVDCSNRYVKEELLPTCSKDFEAFKNTANCNEFFVCVHRFPFKFQCPVELAYNEELGVCDYPSKVQCNVTHIQVQSPVVSEPTTTNEPNVPPTTAAPPPDDKKVLLSKTEFNSQSYKSLQVAMSRQDAIKQLQLGQLAQIHTGY